MSNDDDLKLLLDLILRDRTLTWSEHDLLFDLIGLDGTIDASESALISRIFALIESGEIVVLREDPDPTHLKH